MDAAKVDEQAALIALLRTRPQGRRWSEITAEVLEVGSATAVWERHTTPTLLNLPGEPDTLELARVDLTRWRADGLQTLTVLDAEYPAQLRDIFQVPPILFARGKLDSAECAVSVVGSRSASERGIRVATATAEALVAEGISVVAGLAIGVDAAAHKTALDRGGRTIAIIGTGIDKYYPAANRGLQDLISKKGLVLSQFWPDAPPQRHNFLMRNATMSGYGIATVVIEAGEHSGARSQARMAVEHGRPVILTDLVVNGCEWARQLLGRPRVHVARGATEVMDVLQGLRSEDAALSRAVNALSTSA